MRVNDIITEGKSPEHKAAKIWLKISDLFVDLEDELLEASKTNPVAREAVQHLHNDDLKSLSSSIKKLLWSAQK